MHLWSKKAFCNKVLALRVNMISISTMSSMANEAHGMSASMFASNRHGKRCKTTGLISDHDPVQHVYSICRLTSMSCRYLGTYHFNHTLRPYVPPKRLTMWSQPRCSTRLPSKRVSNFTTILLSFNSFKANVSNFQSHNLMAERLSRRSYATPICDSRGRLFRAPHSLGRCLV
jgi:hypothetical protein